MMSTTAVGTSRKEILFRAQCDGRPSAARGRLNSCIVCLQTDVRREREERERRAAANAAAVRDAVSGEAGEE